MIPVVCFLTSPSADTRVDLVQDSQDLLANFELPLHGNLVHVLHLKAFGPAIETTKAIFYSDQQHVVWMQQLALFKSQECFKFWHCAVLSTV